MTSQSLVWRRTSVEIDRRERKGEKPSEYAPVIAELNEQPGMQA